MKRKAPRLTRRTLLKTTAALAVPAVLGEAAFAAQPAAQIVYESLGVKHVINATGTVTNLGGSRDAAGGRRRLGGGVAALRQPASTCRTRSANASPSSSASRRPW